MKQKGGPRMDLVILSSIMGVGIGESLLSTLAGLSVAIPTYVTYNYLVSQVDGLIYDMERSATDLVNLLSSRRDTYEV